MSGQCVLCGTPVRSSTKHALLTLAALGAVEVSAATGACLARDFDHPVALVNYLTSHSFMPIMEEWFANIDRGPSVVNARAEP